jgi:methionyl aminopeptidase
VQRYVEAKGYGVIREYSGHGIGRQLHEDPLVPNFGDAGTGMVLREGTTLAIEPMVTAGDWKTKINKNRWTVHTIDGSLAAHFEHTIAILNDRVEVLTQL